MALGYYTLEEAAQFLSMSLDDLKQMARNKEIRFFQDKGTMRFRVQDVQELARRRGAMSDPELILGDAPPAPVKKQSKLGGPPTPPAKRTSQLGPVSPVPKRPSQLGAAAPPAPKKPSKLGGPPSPSPATPPVGRRPAPSPAGTPEVFDFELGGDDMVDIGKEPLSGAGNAPKSDPARPKSPRLPIPLAGSDSDVRLVSDLENRSPAQGSDSDVKLVPGDSNVKLPSGASPRPSKLGGKRQSTLGGASTPPPRTPSRLVSDPASPSKRQSRLAGEPAPVDSGVRLVPMDSDSDVKIVGAGSDEVPLGMAPPPSAADSDVRLERIPDRSPSGSGADNPMLLTEEINLDEEIRKQAAKLDQPPTKVKPKSKLQFPTSSPFELSDSDLNDPSSATQHRPKPESSDFDLGAATQRKEDSSDFDLQSGALSEGSSDFDMTPPKADSVVLDPGASDDFSLEMPGEDNVLAEAPPEPGALSESSSGISLNNPVDAGISLEDSDQSLDFDLSLEAEATPRPAQQEAVADSDSSEFELSLEVDDAGQVKGAPALDSDSEFELTLDDSSGLSPLEEAPQVKASGEKDIFETDFEVPALEEDSGSQVQVDTDLDSSDFDIALDDSDIAVEDESGSQVVPLDEDEAGDAAATVKGEQDFAVDDDFGSMTEDGESVEVAVEEEAEGGGEVLVKEVVKEKLIEPAPWGSLPVIFMLPCVVVMLLVGLMGFELVMAAAGYRQPGFITRTVGELIGFKIK